MISTKMSKEEAKEYTSGPSEANAPLYSYGTSLCLDDELLKRLGIDEPPAVGTVLTLVAKVTVTGTSVNQQQDGDKEARCDMQITDMELKGDGPNAASVLYG